MLCRPPAFAAYCSAAISSYRPTDGRRPVYFDRTYLYCSHFLLFIFCCCTINRPSPEPGKTLVQSSKPGVVTVVICERPGCRCSLVILIGVISSAGHSVEVHSGAAWPGAGLVYFVAYLQDVVACSSTLLEA